MGGLTKVASFKVEPGIWANFELVAAKLKLEPADLLRELVAHADSACQAIKAGQIASLDGDVAGWLAKEFPQLPVDQLRLFIAVLASAVDKIEASSVVKG